MHYLRSLSVTVLTFLTIANAASLAIEEGALTGGAGCIPTCEVSVEDSLGSASTAIRWVGDCVQNYQNPSGTLGVDDDHQMTWLRQEDGQVAIDVYRISDKKYDRWAVTNCEGGIPLPGGQCSGAGGGCDVNQILFAAQG